MAKPIEDNDNAKEFWENLSDASALAAATKAALLVLLGIETTGTGTPVSTPFAIGQTYTDTDAEVIFRANGTTDANNWIPVAKTNGDPIVQNNSKYWILSLSGPEAMQSITWTQFIP